jgi:hypothetical protein
MQQFTNEQIERARARLDVIAGDVVLQRASKGELKGLCPFHGEKTPSFYVIPAKRIYHCFGCGAHGTAIDYLMNMRGLEFLDAVRELLDMPAPPPRRESTTAVDPGPERDREDDQAKISQILAGCMPITGTTAAYLYLWSRGLPTRQPGLLAHPALLYTEEADGPGDEQPPWRRWQSRTRRAGEPPKWFRSAELPAIVAPLQSSSGEITALHQIFVSDRFDPSQAKDSRAQQLKARKKTIGTMGDGAIRLKPAASSFGLAEGVETGAAVSKLFRRPVWVACGTARFGFPAHFRERTQAGQRPRLWIPPERPPADVDAVWVKARPPSIWIPDEVESLYVFGDDGEAGRACATYAAGFWRQQGLNAEAIFPDTGFGDFNDQLLDELARGRVR